MILDNDNDRRALMGLLPEAGDELEQNELWNILKLPFLQNLIRPIAFQKPGMFELIIENGRILPVVTELSFNQDLYLSENRKVKIIDYGGTATEDILYQLNFESLTEQDIKNIRAWFAHDLINGALNNFSMIDEDGNTLQVRLWSGKFNLSINDSGVYSASLLLRGE